MSFICNGTAKTIKEMTVEDLKDWIEYFNNTIPTLQSDKYLLDKKMKEKMQRNRRRFLKELKRKTEED